MYNKASSPWFCDNKVLRTIRWCQVLKSLAEIKGSKRSLTAH